jgi:hypothetical protein
VNTGRRPGRVRRLQNLLSALARRNVGEPQLTSWYAVPGASVQLDTYHDTAELRAALASLPYRRQPSGLTSWRMVACHGMSLTTTAAFAFAGTDQIDLSGQPARVLHTGDATAYWLEPEETLLHIRAGTGEVFVYSTDPGVCARWVGRLLREVMTVQLLADGDGVWVRAAACVIDGIGVVIAGPPGCGKTSTLLASVCYLGADFVADDRLLLRPGPGGLIGHPWPDVLHLPRRTLPALPELQHLALELVPTPGTSDDQAGGVLRVEPASLTAAFQCRPTDRVRPRLLLFPTLMLDTPTVPGPQWLRPGAVGPLLRATGLFTPGTLAEPAVTGRFPGFPEPQATGPEERARIAALLTQRIPAAQIAVTHVPELLATHITDLLRQLRPPRV